MNTDEIKTNAVISFQYLLLQGIWGGNIEVELELEL